MPHRIRRLRWTLSATSTQQAFTLRQELRSQLEARLLPALERAFDTASASGEVIHIPRLELRVNVGSSDSLGTEFVEQLERELAIVLQGLGRPSGPRSTRTSVAGSRRDELWRYLETGNAPTVLSAPRAELLARAREHHAAALTWLSGRSAAVWFRWLALVEPRAGEDIRELLASNDEGIAEEPHEPADEPADAAAHRHVPGPRAEVEAMLIRLLVEPATLSQHTRLEFSAAVLEAWGRGDTSGVKQLIKQLRRDAMRQDAWHESVPLRWLNGSTAAPAPAPEPNVDVARRSVPAAQIESTAGHEVSEADVAPELTALPAVQPLKSADSSTGPHAWLSVRTPTSLATPVSAAGLVLLHPFVPALFARMGLTRDRALPQPALAKAAALLHLLATGATNPLEPELSLIKPLLGLPLQAPLLVGDGLLDDSARDEAEAVLRSAITHWSALGQISIAGLRATFLQRGGLVRELPGGLCLSIEPGPFDMLLDRLPWALSIVKFPWMSRPLFVEWTPA